MRAIVIAAREAVTLARSTPTDDGVNARDSDPQTARST